jgi:Ion channel.
VNNFADLLSLDEPIISVHILLFFQITLSTVGYGDFSPKNWVAKLIVCIFAFIGTAFFALPAVSRT